MTFPQDFKNKKIFAPVSLKSEEYNFMFRQIGR